MKKLLFTPVLLVFTYALAFAGQATKPYTFSPRTPGQSAQVNQNFDTIYNAHNATDTAFKGYTSGKQSNEVNALKFGDDISAALSHPSTAGKVVVVSVPMTCNSDTTRPTDRQIKIENGGSIDPDLGKTFNWNGGVPVGDPHYQIHGGAGSVINGAARAKYPVPVAWFGSDDSALSKAQAFSEVVRIDKDITITSPFDLSTSLEGSATVTAPRFNIVADDVTVSGLTFISTGTTLFSIGHTANGDRFTLRNVKVSFQAGVGNDRKVVYADAMDGLNITGCRFITGGIEMLTATNFNISNNVIDYQWIDSAVEPIHNSVGGNGVIHGNQIFSVKQTDAIDSYSSGARVVITDNRIIGLNNAAMEIKVILRDDGQSSGDTGYGYVESTIIANNVIKDITPLVSGEYGVIYGAFLDLRATPSYPTDRSQAGMIITGNLIENFNVTDPTPTVIATGDAIQFEGSNSVISNNVIRNFYSWAAGSGSFSSGIRIGALATSPGTKTISGLTVTGNVISTDGAGIKFGRTTSVINVIDSVFASNILTPDTRSGAKMRRAFAFESSVSVKGCNFSNNIVDLTGATSPNGFYFASATSVFDSNIVSGNRIKGAYVNFQNPTGCLFSGNTFDASGYSSTALKIGTAGTTTKGNKVIGNHFVGAGAGYDMLQLYTQAGFVVANNTFVNTDKPVRVLNTSIDGFIGQNVAINKVAASFVTYTTSSAVTEANNIATP